MVKRTGPTNPLTRKTIRFLRKASKRYGAPIWRRVAELLEKPTRQRIEVNVSKINRYTSNGEYVVVPGKVLGAGHIDHPVVVAALSFSKSAADKIRAAGGRVLSLEQMVEERPDGSNVKILG